MSGRSPPLAALLLPGVLVVAYDGLAHYVSTIPDAARWAAAVTALPAAGLLVGLVGRRFGRAAALAAGVALALALLAAVLWPRLPAAPGGHMSLLYLAQYLATNLALAYYFGHTLGAGRTPACTRFAAILDPAMSPRVQRYTRHVTLAWTLFFVLSAATSALLYACAPAHAWSTFSNLLYLPSLAAMFAVDGLVRRLFVPPDERHGILESLRAYLASTRSGTDTAPLSGTPIRQ